MVISQCYEMYVQMAESTSCQSTNKYISKACYYTQSVQYIIGECTNRPKNRDLKRKKVNWKNKRKQWHYAFSSRTVTISGCSANWQIHIVWWQLAVLKHFIGKFSQQTHWGYVQNLWMSVLLIGVNVMPYQIMCYFQHFWCLIFRLLCPLAVYSKLNSVKPYPSFMQV